MAILTAEQLAQIRRECANEITVDYTKATINAAVQAVEDWWIANQAALSTAINVATSPVVLSVAQKRAIGKFWLKQKFERG